MCVCVCVCVCVRACVCVSAQVLAPVRAFVRAHSLHEMTAEQCGLVLAGFAQARVTARQPLPPAGALTAVGTPSVLVHLACWRSTHGTPRIPECAQYP
jgi:hypothetical protein